MRFVYLVLLGLLFGCKAKTKVTEIKDNDLTIMAIRSKQPAQGGEVTFKVRIFPSKLVLENSGSKLSEEMLYRADSSFYLVHGLRKNYPLYLEPVSNGVKGSYEFMVAFGAQPNEKTDTLIYHDKFINQKKYVLAIN